MKLLGSVFTILFFFTCCQEDPKLRAKQQEIENQKRETLFNRIDSGWNFNSQPINDTAKNLTIIWAEWRVFLNELGQKPKSSIGAFQQKAKTLSKRSLELNNNIPVKYSLSEVKSRIAVITTKVNAINLYLHLNQIPDDKIVRLVQEINTELASMSAQLTEIDRKSVIKVEDGEADMIKMLDATRAVPSNPNLKSTQ